ncbi:TadE family type IV pilus minor pilin [Nocardioides solisilvae]|uniref:TadE family type IV pilus minor pilin n=1 Tax=Nocardioides solisilvae TaxID=1542435 RepID=UPI0013A531EE|nr:TadE family type IV pilus minor pilin [Nocardioides solisilvae]
MTAELALGIPVLVALVLVLAWMVSLGIAQVRVVDAARETARALARGDSRADALALGRRVAGPGSGIEVEVGEGVVVVRVRATTLRAPGRLGDLRTPTVQAEAVAALEVPP